jgi:hypothetical protein
VRLGLDVPLGLIWLGVCTHIAAPAQVSSWHDSDLAQLSPSVRYQKLKRT